MAVFRPVSLIYVFSADIINERTRYYLVTIIAWPLPLTKYRH